jgi:hypothetical protein
MSEFDGALAPGEMKMEIKFSLKIGKAEIEFEGSNETFENHIEPILEKIFASGASSVSEEVNGGDLVGGAKPKANIMPMTAKAIAAKLNAGSGGDLLYAAIASLAVIKQKETFSRQEINDEMKAAVGFYKPSYTSNLSNYIDTLSKQGIVIETSKDSFALKESERSVMEQKLAQ